MKITELIQTCHLVATRDLAKKYNVETKRINEAVSRNKEKFPERFCFRLTNEEVESSRSQIATLNKSGNKRGTNIKYLPYAFTEQGVAMLATVLKSPIAIQVSIRIMDAFVSMHKYIGNYNMELRYINNQVMKNTVDIRMLQESFNKFEEKRKVNEIYFNGQIYDAYSKIVDIMKEASKELIIIDIYADKTVLDMISKIKVKVLLIVKENANLSKLAIDKYQKEYSNLTIVYDNSFHDRYIIIDNNTIYHLGASINHAGSKTFSINILLDNFVKNSLMEKIN